MRKHSILYGRSWKSGNAISRLRMVGKYILNLFGDGDQIICKTYMTRVEGENTRLRHCALHAHRRCKATSNRHTSIARLHRKTLCYSKSIEMLEYSIKLLVHYLKFRDIPVPYRQQCYYSRRSLFD